MEKYFDKVLKCLSDVNWTNVGNDNRVSNVILMKEYLRRAATFIKTNDLSAKLPYLDAAQAYGNNIQIDLEEVCQHLNALNNTFFKQTCICCLKWAILTDEAEPAAVEFHDLYEPLIKLFQRGGTFRLHNGEVIVSNCAFALPSKDYLVQQEPYDISDSALDKLDN